VMKAQVHPADLADREGASVVLERVTISFPNLQHLWADAGYRGADP
jgi:putative transposase